MKTSKRNTGAFLLTLLAAIGATVVGCHGLVEFMARLSAPTAGPPAQAMAPLLATTVLLTATFVFLACGVALYSLRHKPKSQRHTAFIVGLTCVGVTVGHAAGLAAAHLLHHLHVEVLVTIGAFLSLAPLVYCLHRLRHAFLGVEQLQAVPTKEWLERREKENRPPRAIALSISTTPHKITTFQSKGLSVEVRRGNAVEAQFISLQRIPEKIREDIDALDSLKPNWQQLLRGIAPFVEAAVEIEYVTLMASTQSEAFLQQSADLLRPYLSKATFEMKTIGDFDDYQTTLDCFGVLLQERRENGIHDAEVVIDVTGGQKITSAAGAAATLNGSVVFQYVPGTADPIIYDARIEVAPEV
jgi:hypothetical protein